MYARSYPYEDDDGGFGGGGGSKSRSGGGYGGFGGGDSKSRSGGGYGGFGGGGGSRADYRESNPFDGDGGGFGGGFGGGSSKSRGGDDYGRFGGGSRTGYRDGNNPFDGYAGGGGSNSSSSGRHGGMDRARGDAVDYGRSGYQDDFGSRTRERDDYEERLLMANRRMENSSANSLRVLNETMRMGNETVEELERQAESLDRTERRLDEMHVDLDKGERNLRKIKSVFGGISNYFSSRKTVEEVTNPKGFKYTPPKPTSVKSKPPQSKQKQAPLPGTGNKKVDRNLDEIEKALDQLKGIGELMGEQLDDSDAQISRVAYKLERNDIKVKKLNRDIKEEL